MEETIQSVTYSQGTQRIVSPEQTLAHVMPHMQSMGITRIADVTGLDTIGIPVVMVCRPNARSVSLSQGKGSTLAAAKASGLMESIEGFHAEHIALPLRIASLNELTESVSVVAINDLPTVKQSAFHANYPITWIESVELNSGQARWLPYEMVHTNYTLPRPPGSGCFPASSNGLASGNTMAEATVHGICEVIERDAISLWHRRFTLGHQPVAIDTQTINNQACLDTLRKLDAAGQDSYLWDITSDTGIPTYFVVLLDRHCTTSHIGVGSGTHLSREIAVLRALHEAVQVRTTYIVGARDDITAREYLEDNIIEKKHYFSKYIGRSVFSGDFSQTDDVDSGSIEIDLQTLLSALQCVGIHDVLRVDLRKPEFNIAVARIVIPGLESPHDDDDYLPGSRAAAIRRVTRR